MLSLIASCHVMLSWYPWEAYHLLKGSGEAVDLEEKRCWKETKKSRGEKGCVWDVLYDKRENKRICLHNKNPV